MGEKQNGKNTPLLSLEPEILLNADSPQVPPEAKNWPAVLKFMRYGDHAGQWDKDQAARLEAGMELRSSSESADAA